MLDSRLYRLSRYTAFILLAAISAYGAFRVATGDWDNVWDFWAHNRRIVPLLVLISTIDVALEGLAWAWVYHRFDVQAFDRVGFLAFLAGRAGLPMPAQLGRLIRPDAMIKHHRTPVLNALKAEAVVFGLDAISVLTLLGGLVVYRLAPVAAPFAMAVAILLALVLGNTLTMILTKTRLHLPHDFWWRWSTLAIILIMMAGWMAHGLALHVVVKDVPGQMGLWDSMFFGPGTAVLGVATGLPGGIGATEGLLGATLKLRNVPTEHLAVAIAAFRLITFWMWIPIGWAALAILRRMAQTNTVPTESPQAAEPGK